MTKSNNPRGVDLIGVPYVVGKIAGARVLGRRLIEKEKKYRQTEPLSDEFMEYLAAATRAINFLSGFYDAIEEVFGKEGWAKETFERVIDAHTESKADRKIRNQVAVVKRYLADDKPNASKVARETAGNDRLTASQLTNLKRWRKDGRIAALAKADLMLGIDSVNTGFCPPTIKEILKHMAGMGHPID